MDVIVIGAGYTGLAAAHYLSKKKFNVTLLEANQRVGGRTLESIVSENFRLELGGQYIAPNQERVTKLAKELGLETYQAWNQGDNFLSINGQLGRFQSSPAKCLTEVIGLPKSVQLEVEAVLNKLSVMFPEVPSDSPWKSTMAEDWDSITFHSWLSSHLQSNPAKDFFRFMTNQAFSTEPTQISLLQMLWFLKTSHGLPSWAIGGGQANRIEGGTQLLADRLASRLDDKISFYEKVIKIHQDVEKVIVQTENRTFQALFVIVCLPPQLINSIQYNPPLPSDLFRAFGALQTGNSMKVQAVYEKPFWRKHGWSGNGIDFEGPQTFTYDNSGPEGIPGVLLGFLSARRATEWNQKTKEERQMAVLKSWAKVFGPDALNPLEYIEMDWMSDAFSRGGHGCHFPPGVWSELGPALGIEHMPNFKRIFWAASDLAKDWNGYLEGALFAGEQVANEVEKQLLRELHGRSH